MRKVIFGGANSLDNYLARPDHAVDWLLWGDEAATVMADYWKRFDNDVGVRDICSTLEAVQELDGRFGQVGVLGFCLGGKLAVLAAARCDVAAAVSFYGVRLDENRREK